MSVRDIKSGDAIWHNGQDVGIVTSVMWHSGPNGYTSTTLEIGSCPKPSSARASIINAVFGVPGWKKQYRGNLVGNIRIRYRTKGYATIYVRDPYRIREYLLEVDGEYVTHGQEIAQNQRTTPRTK